MKQKLDSFKKWIKTPANQEVVILGSFFAIITGFFVAVVAATVKEAEAEAQAYNKAINEYNENQTKMEKALVAEHNAGKQVYALLDGSFLSVEKDTNPQLLTW